MCWGVEGEGGQGKNDGNINQIEHTEYSLHSLEQTIEPPMHHKPVEYKRKGLQTNQ